MGTIRFALAQINTVVGDFEGNVAKIVDRIECAKVCGTDLVTFPELAVCGYPPEDLLLRPRFLEDNRRAVERIAKESRGIGAVVGFADSAGGQAYNAAAVINDGRWTGTYHKLELPNYGVFDEKRYFSPGCECLVIEAGGARIAVTICEDIWIEEGVAEQSVVENGAHITINISGSPFHAGKVTERQAMLAGFARRTGTFLCYNNLVGGQDELVFDGGSMVVNAQGQVVASAKRFGEELLVVDVEVEETRAGLWQPREASGRWKRRIVLESRHAGERVPLARAPELGRLEEVHAALVLGTKDYARKNGFEKAVIGLSGGIDSSLTAAIAADALGADNVVGVTMPSVYTSEGTLSDAQVVASNLGVQLITVPIQEMFSVYQDALREPFGEGEAGVEAENLQARIRGNILMALSNRFGWLLLNTGNKSETAVGYCTLYGDTAGGFAVLKDVPKTLVYELVPYVNEKAGREVIPRSVLERPPSAELRADQKDEDSLPPYDVLDPILRAYVEEDKPPDEVAAGGFDADLVREVVRMVDRSEYKRRQAPPGVKITPKAFGRDRRLPITNHYRTGTATQ
jgi:NAD+ synthase (glutamine-hydrolysing)